VNFDTSAYLRRATGRAKSDVANKLVSMFLHEVSRRIYGSLDLKVSDPRYSVAVASAFGTNCCYCGRPLEVDRASVEHLDGMNRFRIGLHIPGNVILACTRCNREKRRDDAKPILTIAESGWESFLSHDAKGCESSCNSCSYWSNLWPKVSERIAKLSDAKSRILTFRNGYLPYLELNMKARSLLGKRIDAIYRDCQDFATTRIKEGVEDILQELLPSKPDGI
jgi:HNH endonuclease